MLITSKIFIIITYYYNMLCPELAILRYYKVRKYLGG